MRDMFKIKGQLSEKDIEKMLKIFDKYNIQITPKDFGKSINTLLLNKLHRKYTHSNFFYSIKSTISVKEKHLIQESIIMGLGECKECGGEYEAFDFADDGDEISPKVLKIHKKCIICNNLKTENI
jgi:DNA-directed RNA polymerase subunit E'/Rpb7